VKKTSKRTSASRKRSPRPRRPPRDPLVAFAELARRERLRWYVFGAQAVNLHGVPRTTADLDVTVDLADRDPAQLVSALEKAGFVPRFADPAFVAQSRVIPVIHRASGMPIDVVLAGPGLEQRFLDEAVTHRVAGKAVPVLSVENLVVTKLLAARPKDLEDVRQLLLVGELDERRVRATLAELEAALDQADLLPLFDRLRREALA
jgi:hypothetical protein